MTFSDISNDSFDAALDIIAPRQTDETTARHSAIAAAYAAGVVAAHCDRSQ